MSIIHALLLVAAAGIATVGIAAYAYTRMLRTFHRTLFAVRDCGVSAAVGKARISPFAALYVVCAFDARSSITAARYCIVRPFRVRGASLQRVAKVSLGRALHDLHYAGLPHANDIERATLNALLCYIESMAIKIPRALAAQIREKGYTESDACDPSRGWRLPANRDHELARDARPMRDMKEVEHR